MAETNNESTTELINSTTVSFDGSWLTRDHKSKHGLAVIIDVMSGLAIDYNVMTKFCHSCKKAKNKFGDETAGFSQWYRDHKNKYPINHSESSGAMEKSAMEIIWKRSETYGIRYTKVISDGDVKTFKQLSSLEIYGGDIEIKISECVNHVNKRFRTALEKLIITHRAKGVTLGGRSYSVLKQSNIVKLAGYYIKAIYENKNKLQDIKKAIMATLYHAVSTDENPRHEFGKQKVLVFFQSFKS